MKAVVVGNRPLGSFVIDLIKDCFVVAADAGADRLLKYNIIPDSVVGDLDSISDSAATKLDEWIISNKNIQKTDLEKAVDYALEKGATNIKVVGWRGGRIDHTIAALGLAFNSKIKLIEENFTVEAIFEEHLLEGKEGNLFSLVAMPEARVSVEGARWLLNHEKLKLGGRGIHNEIGPTQRVKIECHSGNLLLFNGKFSSIHD